MARTLIVYDDGSQLLEKAADVAGCFASLVKCVPASQAERLDAYRNLVLVCNAAGASQTLLAVAAQAKEHRTGLLMVGSGAGCREDIEAALGRPLICSAGLETGWLEADGYCDGLLCALHGVLSAVDGPVKTLPREELKARIDAFVLRHDACALACASDGFVRNTALDFRYMDGNFYIVSEGGQKFHAILRDPKVSLLIYDSPKQGGNVTSVQVAGRAYRVPMWSDEYVQILEKTWGNVQTRRNSLVRLNVLKIIPDRMEYFSYTLKPLDVDLKQTYIPDHV